MDKRDVVPAVVIGLMLLAGIGVVVFIVSHM
jgi:hypothetical protein